MIRLHPTVPNDCQVFGFLYWHQNPRARGEDMVDVQLPNGLLISCGWYPEGDANGCYRITVSEGFQEIQRRETDSVHMAKYLVESLALQFGSYFKYGIFVSDTIIGTRAQMPQPRHAGFGWPMEFGDFSIHEVGIGTTHRADTVIT